jgi:hypothetical protein
MYWPGRCACSIELYFSNVASLCNSLLISEYTVWSIIMSYWIIWGFRACGRNLNQFKSCSLITKFRKLKFQSSIIVSWYCSETKGIPLLSMGKWWIRPFENIYLAEWSGYMCLIIALVSFVIVKPFWSQKLLMSCRKLQVWRKQNNAVCVLYLTVSNCPGQKLLNTDESFCLMQIRAHFAVAKSNVPVNKTVFYSLQKIEMCSNGMCIFQMYPNVLAKHDFFQLWYLALDIFGSQFIYTWKNSWLLH